MVGVSPCTELICRQYGVDRVCGSQYSVEPSAGGVYDHRYTHGIGNKSRERVVL